MDGGLFKTSYSRSQAAILAALHVVSRKTEKQQCEADLS
jgi:hypothetical protein